MTAINKARFSGYALTEHFLSRHARRLGNKKLAKQMINSASARMAAFSAVGSASDSPEVQCHYYECFWKDCGKNSIFIKDMETLESIEGLKVDNFDPETVPTGSWIIAPPKRSGLPAFLYSVSTYEEWKASVLHWFPGEAFDPRNNLNQDKNFSTSYRIKHFTYHQNKPGRAYSLGIDGTRNDMGAGLMDHSLDEDEMKLIWRLSNLGLRILIYQMIFPEKVIDGAPNLDATTKPVSRGTAKILEGAGGSSSITAVGLHYRQLRHERYYKGEYADKPVGTRFVRVNPYVRGAKNTKTVSEGEA